MSMDDTDGAWVVAVADGLSIPDGGELASQAAVRDIPERISSRRQMVEVFQAANSRVVEVWKQTPGDASSNPWFAPLTTLCLVACTPEGGTIAAWAGDTLPFIVTHIGSDLIRSRHLGYPHIGLLGGLTGMLGGTVQDTEFTVHGTDTFSIREVDDIDIGSSYAFVVVSDGVWVKALLGDRDSAELESLMWTDLFGSPCRKARSGQAVAESAVDVAQEYGLTDNATAAAAFIS